MPNWTSNTLKAPAEVLKKYISKDNEGNDRFDFNLVIPRPEIYSDPDLPAGGHEDAAIYWYRSERGTKKITRIGGKKVDSSFLERIVYDRLNGFSQSPESIKGFGDPDKLYECGRKYMDAYNKYGYTDWYDWSNANWGTKWNACESYINDDCTEVNFQTAWCYPEPIIKKIFEDNPGILITFEWENEDYDGDHWMERQEDGTIYEGCNYDEHHYDEEEDEDWNPEEE